MWNCSQKGERVTKDDQNKYNILWEKTLNNTIILGLWLRLECSLDSLSIDSAHVIYVSEGYDVAYNRRTASQPSHVVLRVTWYVKTFQKRQLRVLNPARINVFYWFNWLNLIGS